MSATVVFLVVERLGELLISEANFLSCMRDQIKDIRREFKRMQCFLKEADKKQISDDRVRNWVAEIRELAFKIEDVIENFALEEVDSIKKKSGFMKMLLRFACIVNEGLTLHKIGNEINTIKGRLTSLTGSLQTFGITNGLEGETSLSMNLKNRRIFYPHNIEKAFVGMDKEIKQLISHLMEEDQGCEVISICGMGGQGKTTVAKKLYNDSQIQVHFEAFAWICITHKFKTENVLKSLLKQLLTAQRKEEISNMDDLEFVHELWTILHEKKCLIVMDDIWTIDAWEFLCSAFPVGATNSGSKILLTTRNETVAKVGTVYKLPCLTAEEGWQLLWKKAFPSTADGPPEIRGIFEMESIGKKMVKRCKGLPLAVSTLGGILRGKMLWEWEMINRDISFYLARGGGVPDNDEYYTVTRVLGLSYDILPPRLRHCFLCLANIKEDEKIKVEEIYLFWIAEGLISSEDEAKGEMMMDVAERYLEELAHRSLVQVEPWIDEGKSWSKFRLCSLHDLIRDLCLSKVKEEKFISAIDLQSKANEEINNRVHKLWIRSYDHTYKSTSNEHLFPQIRSLLLFRDNLQTNNWDVKILSMEKFKLLRVLTIRGFKVGDRNLRSISNLVYLKYLSFKGCMLEDLPSSIGNLRNLETLDLRVWSDITIPNVLWKLKQLKHLFLPAPIYGSIKDNEKLTFDGLNELEMLENFDSSYCEAHDLVGLRKIKVFRGEITAEQDKLNVENTIEFISSNELRHSSLEIKGEGGLGCLVLLLKCCFIDRLSINTLVNILPREYYQSSLSKRLTSLSLFQCEFEEDPMILLEKLPNLHFLWLNENSYMGTYMICSAIGFPQLESLSFDDLPNLTNWRVDEGALPNLSQLQISECDKLEMLPDGLKFLTSLKQLDIYSMPLTFKDRVRVIDGVEGQDFYKVCHIPNLL